MEKKILSVLETKTVTDYPYGRLKCEATFAIEFKAGKGFRQLFQTINPKTGRVNKPKMSTYQHFGYLYIDQTTGHTNFEGYHISGYKSINEVSKLIIEHPELELNPEMLKYVSSHMELVIVGNLAYSGYTPASKAEVKEFIAPVFTALRKQDFKNVVIDIEKLNSFKND